MVYKILKRCFDCLFSLICIILLFPFGLVIAVVIKFDSKGPVFFRHKRVGMHGKEIGILKFRTMVDNAEKQIQNFSEEQRKEWEENYKLEDDPRITRIGKFLRATSIDELPQLFNILTGTMSFVGPRPITESELQKFGDQQDFLLSVKPGLTGYWACHGRSSVSYDERVRMELYYVSNASIFLDIRIIFLTFFSVLRKEGAK